MERSIPLHKTKGVNPHRGICMGCGADTAVVLVGMRDWVDTCPKCGMRHFGGANKGQCAKCGQCLSSRDRRPLGELEKIPAGYCKECTAANDAVDQEVKEGGVYIDCEECGMHGAVKRDHPLAIEVRKKMNIAAPAPCGAKVPYCPRCSSKTNEAVYHKGEVQ